MCVFLGIGFYTALDFAARGARVILACRNERKAQNAQNKIIQLTKNPNVVYKLIDMTSLSSVRDFAQDINETEDRVDILVNNAGAGGLGDHYTSDGLQITLQVNHISNFLLTHLLIDKIKKSAPSRIVNVSSLLANFSNLKIDEVNKFPSKITHALSDLQLYANSKLANILFTIELSTKLKGTGVTVHALHPGAVNTEIYRRIPPIFKIGADIIIGLYFKTAEEGAQTTIYAAVSEQLDGVTGKLFDNCTEIPMYHKARDSNLAQALWKVSEELAKLGEDEKILY
ncbi:phosphatidylinositol-glycan biosynthesis class f protein-related [Holotrichia oblita]|uniref:Phosphatidylinositol-glycan biosynthesis class f protein-related n=1 Tax=Holotrichia oblita TaxID=644536 RepID=A0ACB9T4H2_HOLOL|nr:phosphatidylinositol-glycan biosynthesis class f protein-related [Holotrichia oblita]